jgi:hypothetical protein
MEKEDIKAVQEIVNIALYRHSEEEIRTKNKKDSENARMLFALVLIFATGFIAGAFTMKAW